MLKDGLARFHTHEEQATARLVDRRVEGECDAAEFNQKMEIVLSHLGAIFSTLKRRLYSEAMPDSKSGL
jgi:hypothetical protein